MRWLRVLMSVLLVWSQMPVGTAHAWAKWLYGEEQPNSAQILNRHFSLWEHAMLGAVLHSGNPGANTEGLPPNAKTIWEEYFKDYEPVRKAMRDKPAETSGAAALAEKYRKGRFKEIASWYLEQTAPGALKAPYSEDKLAWFELSMLADYFRHQPEADAETFKDELSGATFTHDAGDLFLRKERTARYRALTRYLMKKYAEDPPSGLRVPSREYQRVEKHAGAMRGKDATLLAGIYSEAGMKPPEKPAAGANEKPTDAPVMFDAKFSPLEHAVLSTVVMIDPERSAFLADKDEASKDPKKNEAMAAKWKGKIKARVEKYLDPANSASEAPEKQLALFESHYLDFRLKGENPDYHQALSDLGDEAAKDEAGAARMAAALRPLIKRDLSAYLSNPAAADSAVSGWASANLKKGVKLAELFPAGAPGEKPPVEAPKDPVREAVASVFGSPVGVEIGLFIAETWVKDKDAEASKKQFLEDLASAKRDGKETEFRSALTAKAVSEAGNQLLGKTNALTPRLAQFGPDALKAFFCPARPKVGSEATVPAGETAARPQADMVQATGKFNRTAGQGDLVVASGKDGPGEDAMKLEAICKAHEAARDPRAQPPGNGAPGTTVPPPGEGDKKISKDEEDKDGAAEKKKAADNMKRNLVAGAFGAVGFGLVGLILGGPFGLLIGAIGGGLLMAGINQLKNNPIGS